MDLFLRTGLISLKKILVENLFRRATQADKPDKKTRFNAFKNMHFNAFFLSILSDWVASHR